MIKALIVDDDITVRQFLGRILKKKLAIEYVEAENGMAALNVLEKEFPQIIFLDVMMPVMDGLEFLKKLRENQYFNQIPVVMLTAVTDKNVISQSISLGIIDYLLKPFDYEKTIERLQKIINARRDELSKVRPKIKSLEQEITKPIIYTISDDMNFEAFLNGLFKEKYQVISFDPDIDSDYINAANGTTYFLIEHNQNNIDYTALIKNIRAKQNDAAVKLILCKMSQEKIEIENLFDAVIIKSFIAAEFISEFEKITS
ncbi:MAG: response regulator [bacterium]